MSGNLSASLSGIRGIWGESLTSDIVRKYSFLYRNFITKKTGNSNPLIVIGRDTRPSSQEINNLFKENLKCQIIDLGIATTPIIQYAVRKYNADGGIIITASHNPKEHNGFKLLRKKDGSLLDPKDMNLIIDKSMESYDASISSGNTEIIETKGDIIEDYLSFVFGLIGEDKLKRIKEYYNHNGKIFLDPNGGASCIVLERLANKLGIDIEVINKKEGIFMREIEPNKNSLMFLAQKLKTGDIAFGFDCDADRAEIVIDDSSNFIKKYGNIVNGQYILGLIADYFLKNKKQQEKFVVVNDATSYLVKEIAERNKAQFVEVGTGEANIVNKMLELKAVLAGEGSSSGFIHSQTRCRDGILTLLYILAMTSEQEKTLGKIIDELGIFYYTRREDNLILNSEKQEKILEYIKRYYNSQGYFISQPDEFSGLKAIDKNNNWVWFRASATTKGQFRIISDSKDYEKSDSLLKEAILVFKEATKN